MSAPNVTYTNPADNSTCGLARADSWQILRDVHHHQLHHFTFKGTVSRCVFSSFIIRAV